MVKKLSDKEFNEVQDLIFGTVSCEWNKRKKCDSLYIEENIELKKIIDEAREWVKENKYYFPNPTELLEILNYNKDN